MNKNKSSISLKGERAKSKKHTCPECNFCQWCSDERCGICRPTGKKRKKSKQKKHKPLFLNY
ncbi:MAG: hypothetical protein Q8N09_11985 [Thermodesulfovibrionia bacterium]|nr:hypothetical protein [Thermodesulfovibrionia bacterium]